MNSSFFLIFNGCIRNFFKITALHYSQLFYKCSPLLLRTARAFYIIPYDVGILFDNRPSDQTDTYDDVFHLTVTFQTLFCCVIHMLDRSSCL